MTQQEVANVNFRSAEKLHQHNDCNIVNQITYAKEVELTCTISKSNYRGDLLQIVTPLPGCIIIRNALSILEQQMLIQQSLVEYPQYYPNVLQKDYELNDLNVFEAYVNNDQTPVCERQFHGICPVTDRSYARKKINTLPASSLLKKNRWTILGREFDWVNRSYTPTKFPIPPLIDSVTQKIMKATCEFTKFDKMKIEAGVVNYYKHKDRMMAHVDLSEQNMCVPLVSFSLGATGILLMGTKDRKDPPVAIELHSGDALIMYDQCRYAYHGIPRIKNTDFSKLRESDLEYYDQVYKFMTEKNMRININVRQIE